MTDFSCKQCIHAGEPHAFCDSEVVECRCAAVTVSGFPIVKSDSWCSPGKKDSGFEDTSADDCNANEDDSEQPDAHDYITAKDGNGIVTTLHVPTTIMRLHKEVEFLKQEHEINKRSGLWHLIRHW